MSTKSRTKAIVPPSIHDLFQRALAAGVTPAEIEALILRARGVGDVGGFAERGPRLVPFADVADRLSARSRDRSG
jgi:hypothetical protein